MIDSHHHLWNYSQEEYGWIPPGSPLAQDQLIAELEKATSAAGVDATVVVQARQTLAESDWLLSLADQSEIIAGVVGWVPLIDPAVENDLSRLAAHPKFKGVRHVLQACAWGGRAAWGGVRRARAVGRLGSGCSGVAGLR